jgi:hypothetical protein
LFEPLIEIEVCAPNWLRTQRRVLLLWEKDPGDPGDHGDTAFMDWLCAFIQLMPKIPKISSLR